MAQILLIEPDRLLGDTYQAALQHHSHQVSWCFGAQDAIAAIDTQLPDIIILELQLPNHNGVEFLYELRSYSDLQSIPVIVLSHVPPVLRAISPVFWEQLGITAYHYKPLTKLADITRSVDRALAVTA
ncbi:MAG TPA: response regulator [Patescibacteria group bacterium]|nr:response regulator [Patescibacteria group bacterium]